MDQVKEYTTADLETAKKVTSIDVNLSNLSTQFGILQSDMKDSFAELNKSIPAMRTDLNQTMTMSLENKLAIKGLDVRVGVIEVAKTSADGQKETVRHIWRDVLAVLGFIGLIAGTIATLINLFHQLPH